MRVAVLIDAWLPFLGGGQKAVLEITKVLKKNYEIKFVIFHSFSKIIFFRFLWAFFVIPQLIFYHFFIEKFDLIDARAFIAGLPGKALSLILKIPVVYTVNGCGNLDRSNKGLSAWLERILLLKIRYDQQISDSEHFLKYKGVNQNKNVVIIPNGVDIGKFESLKVEKSNRFTIVYVGRLAEIKGLLYLLKAIKRIKEKRDNFLLKIIGQGEEEKRLKDYVKKKNLGKWVNFLGKIKGKRLIKEYESSHLFVLPSLAEGQPITLLEAWAAKLPVVVSRVGSLPYFVNKENGYLVEAKNDKKLAKIILKAMENRNLAQMGKNGHLLVKKNYSWVKAAKSYFQIYTGLVGKC